MAHDAVEARQVDFGKDLPRLGGGPLIAVEDRRAQRRALAVHGRAAHHLPAQSHYGDFGGTGLGRL